MTGVWAIAALWFGLALVGSLLSQWFRVSAALAEIVVGIIIGTMAQAILGATVGQLWERTNPGSGFCQALASCS